MSNIWEWELLRGFKFMGFYFGRFVVKLKINVVIDFVWKIREFLYLRIF